MVGGQRATQSSIQSNFARISYKALIRPHRRVWHGKDVNPYLIFIFDRVAQNIKVWFWFPFNCIEPYNVEKLEFVV